MGVLAGHPSLGIPNWLSFGICMVGLGRQIPEHAVRTPKRTR